VCCSRRIAMNGGRAATSWPPRRCPARCTCSTSRGTHRNPRTPPPRRAARPPGDPPPPLCRRPGGVPVGRNGGGHGTHRRRRDRPSPASSQSMVWTEPPPTPPPTGPCRHWGRRAGATIRLQGHRKEGYGLAFNARQEARARRRGAPGPGHKWGGVLTALYYLLIVLYKLRYENQCFKIPCVFPHWLSDISPPLPSPSGSCYFLLYGYGCRGIPLGRGQAMGGWRIPWRGGWGARGGG